MWFVGLIIGGFIGAIVRGGEGFLFGAALGAVIGALLRQGSQSSSDSRVDAIGRAIDELRARVSALERRAEVPHAAPESAVAPEPRPAAREAPASSASAVSEPVETPEAPLATAEDLAELARVNAAVEAAAREAPAQSQKAHEVPAYSQLTQSSGAPSEIQDARTPDVRNQVIGAVIGALIGASGGFAASVFCAFLGWVVVFAAQSHNRRVERDALRRKRTVAAPAVDASAPETGAEAPPVSSEGAVAGEPHRVAGAAASPIEPREPASDWFRWLIGGNIVAKIGVLVLFFGVGFLLKYIYDHAVLPIPLRLAGVAAAGFGMIYIGWRLRERRRLYGLILQGGGIGLLYLDVYFALRVYNLIAALPGFAAFMGLGVAATLLAVRQNAKVLAVLGLTGAFLAPILASTQTGNHVALFSYYTLLNAFILAISWFKAWRDLNLVGFIFTFVVGVTWGAGNYRPENFATVEPFVLIFFAMYLVIPILFAQRQPPQLGAVVDGTLVFGTPLCAAFMQAWLVKDMSYGLAWSSGVAAGLYAVLAASTLRREGLRLLGETYFALAAAFLTLAIFFAFDAYVTFALWTLEGAAIFWLGLRQRRVLARLFGLGLQIAGTVYFLIKYSTYDLSNPWWNDFVSGCVIIAAAGFITAWLVKKHRDVMDPALEPDDTVLLVWSALWWSAAVVHVLRGAYEWPQFMCGLLAFTAFTAAAFELAGARLEWTQLRRLTWAHLPALLVIALMIAFGEQARLGFARPLAEGGYWAWPLNFAVFFWIHARHTRAGLQAADSVAYRGAWLFLGVIATWDAMWLLNKRFFGQALTWGGAGIGAAYLRFRLREHGRAGALSISPAVLAWGVAVWLVSGVSWIEHAFDDTAAAVATLAFAAGSCLAFELFGTLARWSSLRHLTLVLPAAMAFALILQLARDAHPFSAYGWIAWPACVASVYVILRRQEEDRVALVADIQHVVTLWLAVAVATWEAAWQLRTGGFGTTWSTAAWGLVPAVALGAVSFFAGRSAWPFGARYETAYRVAGLGPIAAWLGLWMIYANVTPPGTTHPLPYVPILNPLDVTHVLALAALWRWSRAFPADEQSRSVSALAFAALGFLWLNCILMRTVHYWTGVEYEWHALMQSVPVQSGLSLLWTAAALVLMLSATRRRSRQLWIAGAALLAVVVVKLFVHDLGNVGTIARIVSFIGVGAGLLVIGYVAPVPPGDIERQAD